MGVRTYDPARGLWMSPDLYIGQSLEKIAEAGQEANLFQYAANNPVTKNDPFGMDSDDLFNLFDGGSIFNLDFGGNNGSNADSNSCSGTNMFVQNSNSSNFISNNGGMSVSPSMTTSSGPGTASGPGPTYGGPSSAAVQSTPTMGPISAVAATGAVVVGAVAFAPEIAVGASIITIGEIGEEVYSFEMADFSALQVAPEGTAGELGAYSAPESGDFGTQVLDEAAGKDAASVKNPNVPQKAYDVLDIVKKQNGAPPRGYAGQRTWQNKDGVLPTGNYKEYDVDPKVPGINRNSERFVLEQFTGKSHYTNDHYETFHPMN